MYPVAGSQPWLLWIPVVLKTLDQCGAGFLQNVLCSQLSEQRQGSFWNCLNAGQNLARSGQHQRSETQITEPESCRCRSDARPCDYDITRIAREWHVTLAAAFWPVSSHPSWDRAVERESRKRRTLAPQAFPLYH